MRNLLFIFILSVIAFSSCKKDSISNNRTSGTPINFPLMGKVWKQVDASAGPCLEKAFAWYYFKNDTTVLTFNYNPTPAENPGCSTPSGPYGVRNLDTMRIKLINDSVILKIQPYGDPIGYSKVRFANNHYILIDFMNVGKDTLIDKGTSIPL